MEIVYGKNAIKNIVENSKRTINKIYVQDDKRRNELSFNNIVVKDLAFLNKITKNAKHQGFVAEVSDFEYYDFNFIRKIANEKNILKLITLDKVQDPQNFGQIIRTAECFGIDAIIIPNKSTSLVTSSVVKSSTGASEIIPIVKVSNLNNTVKELKNINVWNIATDSRGNVDVKDLPKDISYNLILGSEGYGISRLLLENADIVSSINLKGKVNSLNVSASCAIFLSHL